MLDSVAHSCIMDPVMRKEIKMKENTLFKTERSVALTAAMRRQMVYDLISGATGDHSLKVACMTDEQVIARHAKRFPVPFELASAVA